MNGARIIFSAVCVLPRSASVFYVRARLLRILWLRAPVPKLHTFVSNEIEPKFVPYTFLCARQNFRILFRAYRLKSASVSAPVPKSVSDTSAVRAEIYIYFFTRADRRKSAAVLTRAEISAPHTFFNARGSAESCVCGATQFWILRKNGEFSLRRRI